MKAKKWEILAAVAAGAAIATSTTGCAFFFMLTARADNSAIVKCTEDAEAEAAIYQSMPIFSARFTMPDSSPTTWAQVRAVTIEQNMHGGPAAVMFRGSTAYVPCDPKAALAFAFVGP